VHLGLHLIYGRAYFYRMAVFKRKTAESRELRNFLWGCGRCVTF
jgi:hypothetical protein